MSSVIREETEGFKVLLDLKKRDKAEIVAALEAILARLKPAPGDQPQHGVHTQLNQQRYR